MKNKTAILRNVTNNTMYRHLEGNRYRNLCTGEEGEVPPDKAQQIFKINLEATHLINENPNVELLIEALKLKIDK